MKIQLLKALIVIVGIALLINFTKLISWNYFSPELSHSGVTLLTTQEQESQNEHFSKCAFMGKYIADNLSSFPNMFDLIRYNCDEQSRFEVISLQPLTSDPQVAIDFFYSWASENQLDLSKLKVRFVDEKGQEISID